MAFLKRLQKKLNAECDVLFAVKLDESKSDILEALQTQVKSEQVFTVGITYVSKGMKLFRPVKKTGIRISELSIATKLPKPFNEISKVPGLGHNIHHKFVIVDFKGENPVVY